MSVASWVVIAWKVLLMRRAHADVARCMAAFWQAPHLEEARRQVAVFDRGALVLPLVAAAHGVAQALPGPAVSAPTATLAQAGSVRQQLTRVLRDALHAVLGKLQWGQVMLAAVGSTAPFVGLLGTVSGHLPRAHGHCQCGSDHHRQSGCPVGEALIMTAAGLAVAIPAVLAYNVFGRLLGRIEADLEGFARDLRATGAGRRRNSEQRLRPRELHLPWLFGRLERTTAPQPLSDINMTPLIDVMLVLVVIFILTAPLLASAIRLELPRTAGAAPGSAAQSVTVVLDKASSRCSWMVCRSRRMPWPSTCKASLPHSLAPRCNCAPMLPVPYWPRWSRSWALHTKPG